MILRFALLMFLALPSLHHSAVAEEIEVKTERVADAGQVNVEVRMSLPFKYAEVMEVLNDYARMPEFVPDIQEVELISSGPGSKQVRLKGGTTLLFLHFPLDVLMEVKLHSATHVSLQSLAGNLGVSGDVQLEPGLDGTRVSYVAHLRPAFWIPPVIGPYIIGAQIRKQFEGKVAEMHRRYDARQANLSCASSC